MCRVSQAGRCSGRHRRTVNGPQGWCEPVPWEHEGEDAGIWPEWPGLVGGSGGSKGNGDKGNLMPLRHPRCAKRSKCIISWNPSNSPRE